MELEWRETVNAGGDPVWIALTDNGLYKLLVATRYFAGTRDPWYAGEIIFRPTGRSIRQVPYISPQTGMRGLERRMSKL